MKTLKEEFEDGNELFILSFGDYEVAFITKPRATSLDALVWSVDRAQKTGGDEQEDFFIGEGVSLTSATQIYCSTDIPDRVDEIRDFVMDPE